MSKEMTPKQLKETNIDRAALMVTTLTALNGIPILVGAVQPATNQLIVFGFSNTPKENLREMLTDFLKSLDQANYVVPGQSSSI